MLDDDAIPLPRPRTPHIKKRALKNKALTVSFNEKDLRDYVTGFHKRKKKRRKEAEQQQAEALRRKRIELRKKRKLEKELVYGGGGPSVDAEGNEIVVDEEDEEEEEEEEEEEDLHKEPISGTMTYDSGDVQVTVTTSEISREEEDLASLKRASEPAAPVVGDGATKKPKTPVKIKTVKKPFKRVSKPKASKSRNKRDKSKAGKRNKKRK